jgi:Family of unknown function (DUF6339)
VRLYRLGVESKHLVTRALASGELARHETTAYERYLEECEVAVDLDPLDAVVEDVLASTVRHDAGIDRAAAPALHRALPLPRREAAQPGLWRFLAVAHRPDFVRHRWENRSWATTRTRFWTPGTRPDSNAFSRLWWIAELTRDGDSYLLTEQVLERQPLATQLFVRQFSHHRAAVAAFVDVMGDAAAEEIDRVARELNRSLSTLTLEMMDEAEIRELLRDLRESV